MASNRGDRRDFLKWGAAGFAGMTLLPSALGAEEKDESAPAPEQDAETKSERAFIYRTLGKTGIKLPIISMGARFGSPDQIQAALDTGIVHIDTANVYGRGKHEESVGQAIKGRSRDSYVIGTKIYMNMDQKTGLYPKDAKPGPFLEKFETSLKRLGLEYVDILYLHDVVRGASVTFEPFLSAMQKLKKEGKARFLGVSTHTNEPEVIHAAVEGKAHDVVLTSYNFLQPHLAEMEKAIDRAAKAGLGIVAMKTQAGVYWDKERQQPINMKAALKWVLNNGNVHTAIPGFASFEELETDLSIMQDLTLTPEERKDLRLGEQNQRAGLFCPQCGKCRDQCPEDVDVPTLMRGYMYAYGYRNLGAAKEALRHVDLSRLPCDTCGTCQVADCSMGFDVREKARDIARIRRVPDDFIA